MNEIWEWRRCETCGNIKTFCDGEEYKPCDCGEAVHYKASSPCCATHAILPIKEFLRISDKFGPFHYSQIEVVNDDSESLFGLGLNTSPTEGKTNSEDDVVACIFHKDVVCEYGACDDCNYFGREDKE